MCPIFCCCSLWLELKGSLLFSNEDACNLAFISRKEVDLKREKVFARSRTATGKLLMAT